MTRYQDTNAKNPALTESMKGLLAVLQDSDHLPELDDRIFVSNLTTLKNITICFLKSIAGGDTTIECIAAFNRFFFREAYLSFENCLDAIDYNRVISIEKTEWEDIKDKILKLEIFDENETAIIESITRKDSVLTIFDRLMKKLKIDKKEQKDYKDFFIALGILRNKCSHGLPLVEDPKDREKLEKIFPGMVGFDNMNILYFSGTEIFTHVFEKLFPFYLMLFEHWKLIHQLERRDKKN